MAWNLDTNVYNIREAGMYERVNGRESAKDWNADWNCIPKEEFHFHSFENVVDRDKRSTENS